MKSPFLNKSLLSSVLQILFQARKTWWYTSACLNPEHNLYHYLNRVAKINNFLSGKREATADDKSHLAFSNDQQGGSVSYVSDYRKIEGGTGFKTIEKKTMTET